MCYTKSQIKFVVGAALLVACFGAFFAVSTQQIALESEALNAASVL
jgi:hypothetical protein